ncbi:MAG: hypothetical protein ACOC0C_01025 [Bacteroidota bacterium]
MDNVEKINNTDITKDTLLVMKDEIYKSYPGKVDLFEDFNAKILDSMFSTMAFSSLLENTPEIETRVEEKLAFIDYFDQTIDYKLKMPGTILESNARDIPGDTLHWKVDAYRFAVDDYTVYAKSKHMNNGIIIISFIILLVFIMSFMNYMRNRFMP